MRIRALTVMFALCLAVLARDPAIAQEQVGTLALDSSSFVSYSDAADTPIPSGSVVRFHFGTANPDGSIPLTVAPADLTIAPIAVGGGATLRYTLAEPAAGTLRRVGANREIELVTKLVATLEPSEGGAPVTYQLRFSTGTEQATNAAQTEIVTVEGTPAAQTTSVRLVGAATNDPEAFPGPGEAVYGVLSGSFDWLPAGE